MIAGLARQRQTGGVRRGGGTVSGAWAGGRSPDGPSDRVCGAVRLLRRLAGADVSSAVKRRRTSRQCSGRALAPSPMCCLKLVGAEIMSIFALRRKNDTTERSFAIAESAFVPFVIPFRYGRSPLSRGAPVSVIQCKSSAGSRCRRRFGGRRGRSRWTGKCR